MCLPAGIFKAHDKSNLFFSAAPTRSWNESVSSSSSLFVMRLPTSGHFIVASECQTLSPVSNFICTEERAGRHIGGVNPLLLLTYYDGENLERQILEVMDRSACLYVHRHIQRRFYAFPSFSRMWRERVESPYNEGLAKHHRLSRAAVHATINKLTNELYLRRPPLIASQSTASATSAPSASATMDTNPEAKVILQHEQRRVESKSRWQKICLIAGWFTAFMFFIITITLVGRQQKRNNIPSNTATVDTTVPVTPIVSTTNEPSSSPSPEPTIGPTMSNMPSSNPTRSASPSSIPSVSYPPTSYPSAFPSAAPFTLFTYGESLYTDPNLGIQISD
eukprot:scaffold611_cov80-Skeletonema_menzelii.AAC.1